MSVINSMAQGKRAYLFADRAITDQQGLLIGTMCKFIKGTNFPWAMSYSGHGDLCGIDPNGLIHALNRYPLDTPRKLADALVSALRDMTAANPARSIGAHLAAWSSKLGRPVLMFADNDGRHFPGMLPAFQIGEGTHLVQGTRTVIEYLGREVDFEDPRSFDPLVDGLKLMQAQRDLERFERAYETPAHRIGGGCEVAIVGRRGVQLKTLWEWPDKLGEMIDPVGTVGRAINQ